MLKEISVLNTIEENRKIFDSIKVGERFYIVFKNIGEKKYELWKRSFIKIDESENENRYVDNSFLHEDSALVCTNIPCCVCAFSKKAGSKLISIKNK